jgi:hypothetical protein
MPAPGLEQKAARHWEGTWKVSAKQNTKHSTTLAPNSSTIQGGKKLKHHDMVQEILWLFANQKLHQ